MHGTRQLERQRCSGKLETFTSLVGELDDAIKSLLPHVYDLKNGLNFLINTGSEISALKPYTYDKRNRTEDQYLCSANKSCIATCSN